MIFSVFWISLRPKGQYRLLRVYDNRFMYTLTSTWEIRRDDDTEDEQLSQLPRSILFTPADGYRTKRMARSPISTYDDLYAMAHFRSRTFKAYIEAPGIALDWLKIQEELLRHVKQAEACDADSVLTLNDTHHSPKR